MKTSNVAANEIYVKSPTRVDLAGGTLDVGKLFLLFDQAVTVNFAIQISTHVRLCPKSHAAITVKSRDLNLNLNFASLNAFLNDTNPGLKLLQTVIRYFQPTNGFELETWSESPVGGGLGGSSSLTVGLIKAFGEWQKRQWRLKDFVELATNLEAQVLRKPTGTQDYFPAICGGLSVIEYNAEGPKLQPVNVNMDFLNSRFFLVYTGEAHNSGINNWDVLKACYEKDTAALRGMDGLRQIADSTALLVRAGQFEKLPEIFDQELKLRREMCSSYVSPVIEKLYALVMREGARAMKVCGAGGGGCVMVWCDPDKKQKLQDSCRSQGFQVLVTEAQSPIDVSSVVCE